MNKETIIAHDPQEKKAICDKCKLVNFIKKYYFQDGEKSWYSFLCKDCANTWALSSIITENSKPLSLKIRIKNLIKKIRDLMVKYSGMDKN